MTRRRPLVATQLVLTVQWRARFPQIYFGVAILAVVVFRTLIPAELVPLAVPPFLFGEPGSLGILMVAAQRYMERGERSVVALAVTPLTSGEYVSALIFGSAIVPTLATAMIQAGVLGVDARVADSALVIFGMLARDRVDAWAYAGSLGLLCLFAVLAWRAAIATYAARVRREIGFA
jgi:hypothetical protein